MDEETDEKRFEEARSALVESRQEMIEAHEHLLAATRAAAVFGMKSTMAVGNSDMIVWLAKALDNVENAFVESCGAMNDWRSEDL